MTPARLRDPPRESAGTVLPQAAPYGGDPRLDAIATGREGSLFDADMAKRAGELAGGVADKRVLVLGGAGSIGAATVQLVLGYRPAAVHIVDISENALAELTRDLRSRSGAVVGAELRFLPLDLGSAAMERVLREEQPYQLVLHFAAQKPEWTKKFAGVTT